MLVTRFAPSTTGQAHPGTLLSALLVWLDARASGGQALLRLENLDHTRCKPEWLTQMIDCLAWLGLAWDAVVVQTDRANDHAAQLDRLADQGRLYACTCTRTELRGGVRAPDGGWAYDNRCRNRTLAPGAWRSCTEAIRVRLDDGAIQCIDESGLDLSQTPALAMGDPIVRRRDGVVAYQLAVVADDIAAGVNRVVRGRDIAPSTATQVSLYQLLGAPPPRYRHHFLLLEPRTDHDGAAIKLAKLHGAIPFEQLQRRYDAATLLGQLAFAANLRSTVAPVRAIDLVDAFDWSRVQTHDVIARWEPDHGLAFQATQ
ncbi:MAG TPA: glutamate--tRNA ligase family protein [Kofleriaceae bacterium]|nr:glutamate--tRNA ligase family protein [Kofleriaceae bacterium]